jgi:hypothetical protein
MNNMQNEKFLAEIEEFFGVYQSDNYIELETWTDGGVNMFVNLDIADNKTLFEQFKERVYYFNIDEEIDMHRTDSQYKSAFTISESIKDFTDYKNWLNSVVEKLSK